MPRTVSEPEAATWIKEKKDLQLIDVRTPPEYAEGHLANAKLIRETLTKLGYRVYGGVNAPYIWVRTPQGIGSWEFFDLLLNKANLVCTPGAGFGPAGEGYVRLTAFGLPQNVREALDRFARL